MLFNSNPEESHNCKHEKNIHTCGVTRRIYSDASLLSGTSETDKNNFILFSYTKIFRLTRLCFAETGTLQCSYNDTIMYKPSSSYTYLLRFSMIDLCCNVCDT